MAYKSPKTLVANKKKGVQEKEKTGELGKASPYNSSYAVNQPSFPPKAKRKIHVHKKTAVRERRHEQRGPSFALSTSPHAFFLWFFLAMLFFALYLLYEVFSPFLDSLILACIFTALYYPVYERFLTYCKNIRPLASFLSLFMLTVLVVIPIGIFVATLIPQASKTIIAINSWLTTQDFSQGIDQHLQPLIDLIHSYLPELDLHSIDIQSEVLNSSKQLGQMLLGAGTYLVTNTVSICIHFFLILLIMFFLLQDGKHWLSTLQYYYPLKPRQTTIVMEGMRRMSKAVLVGGFAVALLQAIVGGIGFAIVGLPAFLWGTVMIFAALVPVFGTGLVWLPAILFLYVQGSYGSALFLLLWCGIGVTSIDSFLRPILVRGGANVPLLFIFLAILGGINVFGFLGLLYGPMILGFAAIMLDIYGEEYHSFFQKRKDDEVIKNKK